MTFMGVLEAAGKDFAKGLKFVIPYAIPAGKLVGLLFPAAAPVAAEAADAVSLIQTAVLMVEQKYAASGVQSGTGAEKLGDVLLMATDSVTSLLAKAGIAVTPAYVSKLVSAVVAILNVQPAVAAAGK